MARLGRRPQRSPSFAQNVVSDITREFRVVYPIGAEISDRLHSAVNIHSQIHLRKLILVRELPGIFQIDKNFKEGKGWMVCKIDDPFTPLGKMGLPQLPFPVLESMLRIFSSGNCQF